MKTKIDVEITNADFDGGYAWGTLYINDREGICFSYDTDTEDFGAADGDFVRKLLMKHKELELGSNFEDAFTFILGLMKEAFKKYKVIPGCAKGEI